MWDIFRSAALAGIVVAISASLLGTGCSSNEEVSWSPNGSTGDADTGVALDTGHDLDAHSPDDADTTGESPDASTPDTAHESAPDAAHDTDFDTAPDVASDTAPDTDTSDDVGDSPDVSEPEPESCPPLSHSLPRDTRASYNLGNNPNYPASSTHLLWYHEPGGKITQQMGLLKDHYAALEFTTAGQLTGRIQFEATSLAPTPGSTVWALSKCPGQFTGLPDNCVNTGYFIGVPWTVGYPDEDYPFNCALETDTTYYLNLAHAPSPTELETSNCSDSYQCGSVFIHSGVTE